jgi:hypothetical protein
MTWRALVRSVPHKNGVPIDIGDEEQWMNDQYVVNKRVQEGTSNGEPSEMIHLSIRRQDRAPIRDWRDFQRIKNQLAGPEWEAVEIYPAESRKVDGANQYHLWCFPFKLGFGFDTRLVSNSYQTEKLTPGAVQRDPEKVDLQYGGLTKLKDQMDSEEE